MKHKRRKAKYGETRVFFEKALSYKGTQCLLWPFAFSGPGYANRRTGGKSVNVHRVVCEAINGPPPTSKHMACHSCRNATKGCIAPKHLSWKTPKQNSADRVRDGTHSRGERSPWAKLTAKQAAMVRRSKLSGAALARQLGVSTATISYIRTGKRWR